MTKARGVIIVAVVLSVSAGLYFAYGQSISLLGITISLNGIYLAQFEQAAQKLLNAPLSQLLSGGGLASVRIMSGATRPTASAAPRSAGAVGAEDRTNTLGNNPSADTYSFYDVSTHSETAVAGFGQNILIAYNDSTGFIPPANSLMAWSRSTDGGSTFNELGYLPVTSTGLNGGDPGLTANRAGVFYASAIAYDFNIPPSNQGGVGIWKSSDGGNSWTGPVYTPLPPNTFPNLAIGDKPFIAVDNSGKQYDGQVYISWTNFGSNSPGTPIVLSRSTDGGKTFSTPVQITSSSDVAQGSAPAIGPNGEVYVSWFHGGCPSSSSSIYVAKSVDGGQTFGTPVSVAPVEPLGFGAGYFCYSIGGTLKGNFRVNSFPRIDVNPTNGHVYIVYGSHSDSSTDSGNAFFTRSTDGGQTWSTPLKLNDDSTNNDQFFPAIAVNGQGVIQVIWYDRRSDPNNLLIDVYSAESTNDGVSFNDNQRVTTVSSPPAVGYDPIVDSTYMGDYIDVRAITGATSRGLHFLEAWGDFRRRIQTFGGVRNNQDVRFVIK